MHILDRFTLRKDVVPVLDIIEKPPLLLEPFGEVEGTIMRSTELPRDRWGDSIWQGPGEIFVMDASAPGYKDCPPELKETKMVKDLEETLSTAFCDSSLSPGRLLDALDGVLNSVERIRWNGDTDYGVSCTAVRVVPTDKCVTIVSIGTNTVLVNGRVLFPPSKRFYHPFPMPNSRAAGVAIPKVCQILIAEISSLAIHTDGLNYRSGRPISIAPRAKEATILIIER